MISLTTAGWRGRASAKGELSVLLYICRVLFLGGIGPFFLQGFTFFGGGSVYRMCTGTSKVYLLQEMHR